jgi:hypothetical protein
VSAGADVRSHIAKVFTGNALEFYDFVTYFRSL